MVATSESSWGSECIVETLLERNIWGGLEWKKHREMMDCKREYRAYCMS